MAMIEGPGIPAGVPQVAPPVAQPGNGLAVAGLVLGILALLAFWLPVVGLLFGVAALVLSILAKKKASTGASGGGMAMAGLVISILALLGSAAAGACQVACFMAGNRAIEESKRTGAPNPLDAFRKQLEKETQKGGAAPADAPDEAPEEEPAPAK